MPIRASKKKTRQRSPQDLETSPSTGFERLYTEKTSLTEEQVLEQTQQIENKITREAKDEHRRTENFKKPYVHCQGAHSTAI